MLSEVIVVSSGNIQWQREHSAVSVSLTLSRWLSNSHISGQPGRAILQEKCPFIQKS